MLQSSNWIKRVLAVAVFAFVGNIYSFISPLDRTGHWTEEKGEENEKKTEKEANPISVLSNIRQIILM